MAVVIVSYHSVEHLRRLLPTLPTRRLAAVTVVDNASGDGSAEVAAAIAGVTVVASDRNLGFGAGCNLGVDHSPPTADVLFLNPDAAIDPASIERLCRHLADNQQCALAGPRLFRDGEPLWSSGADATLATELRRFAPLVMARRLRDRRHDPRHAVSGPVSYVEGACMLVRRRAFEEVGRFDPAFFLFFEELDLANRLRRHGWSVHLVADAQAQHAVAASRAQQAHNARAELVESTVRYFAKWRGRRYARLFVLLARPMWRLRVARKQLSRDEYSAYVRAARLALSAVSEGLPTASRAASPPRRSG